MSNIVIYVDETSVSAELQIQLQQAMRKSLSDIRSALASGTPVFEQTLFDSRYDDHAAVIRNVLTVLEIKDAKHRIYEFPEGESIESCKFADRCLVGIETIRSILNQADAELDRQLGM
jgi:hypothetical protein